MSYSHHCTVHGAWYPSLGRWMYRAECEHPRCEFENPIIIADESWDAAVNAAIGHLQDPSRRWVAA